MENLEEYFPGLLAGLFTSAVWLFASITFLSTQPSSLCRFHHLRRGNLRTEDLLPSLSPSLSLLIQKETLSEFEIS
jgi:hypothetical protein